MQRDSLLAVLLSMSKTTRAKTGANAGPTVPTVQNKRVVAYTRVSTTQQVDEGHSLEAQKEKLIRYAELYNLEIVAFEVDAGASASDADRPGLKSALARLDRFEASGLLVVKLDRLTRSIADLDHLVRTYFKDGQNSLMSVGEQIDTSSASGRLVINILTVVSQWERETICERTSAVMKHMKDTGKFTGGFPPFGFFVNDEGELEEHAVEQNVIRLARVCRADSMSLRDIAAYVGSNPRTGKPFDPKQIQRML